ncbi:transmembrane protein 231 [Trichonephila inaurata madagascariensis]|uniref:Transmembrane protein 231 n=1 Tax=Trichonephila inaurata madagascariensis TaxID=2747483 RepID=A0A8X7BTV7_9ARAC|nr:transmembrane protein 231 [Trichonephila inaurata madagascariensis]
MAVYEVFSHPLLIRYKTSICSKTTCFYVFVTLFTYIFPFIITYYSQGFWKKIDIYREQPDVSFKHQMVLLLETESPDQLIFWSTYEKLNQLMDHKLLQIKPSIEHREEDHNRDGKKDELHMVIEVPLTKEKIVSLKLILIFDYYLYLYSDFHMESAAYVQYSTSLSGSSFSTFGELSLMQRQPLRHTGKDDRYNIPVLNISKIDRPFISLENILLEYMKRNITTSLKNVYSVWQAGHAAYDSFKINLVILYSEDSILYTLGFWQLLKWALVQYMAVFILISYILKKIKLYLFQKQMLSAIVINPLKQKV